MFERHGACRICGNEHLKDVVSLGDIYPSTFVDPEGSPVGPFPLELVQCMDCGLMQLGHTLDLDVSYRQYWYMSSLNATMIKALEDVYEQVTKRVDLEKDDVVVDIGCNDGTLLKMYGQGVYRIGVDPARNLADKAMQHCESFINDYFCVEAIPAEFRGEAKVVTSIAMFYDLPDPNKFIEDVKAVMADDGLWVIQMMDLKSMMETFAFDNICFEHLEYYSLEVLINTLAAHDMVVEDVSYNDVNGGSLRAYVRKAPWSVKSSVRCAAKVEKRVLEERPVEMLADVVKNVKRDVSKAVAQLSEIGPVYVLGASTKGNTLLQVCGLDVKKIPKALEVNEDKFGMKTVATDIPIVPEEDGMKDKPAALLVLPWHFMAFFEKIFHEPMLNDGMKLIAPLPETRVIGKE